MSLAFRGREWGVCGKADENLTASHNLCGKVRRRSLWGNFRKENNKCP